jgi:leader peptidase (prepilin peptidase)/N-methyltransferase
VAAGALILLIRGAYWLVRRREGMGLGDAKLFALIAAWLGPWQSLLVLFLGVVTAAVFSLLCIWLGNSRQELPGSRRRPMPLAEKQGLSTEGEQGRRGLQPSQNPAARAGALAPEVFNPPSIQQIPLGSFLCAAAIYAIFCGEQTLKWYLQFFH